MSDVVAIVCGDLHLCHNRPSARVDEYWYGVMEHYLGQLRSIQNQCDVPILCAGDVFDKWMSPPELINFAMDNMPKVFAVPGQHDLPYHGLSGIRKSAYWTLVEAGIIVNLTEQETWLQGEDTGIWVSGFPWGSEVKPPPFPTKTHLNIAVIHAYIWKPGFSYPGAPEKSKTGAWKERLEGFDIAVFGDNHQHFTKAVTFGGCLIWNCGTFIRRKADEIDERPCVGLVYDDGTIVPEYLNIGIDQFVDLPEKVEAKEQNPELLQFLNELDSLDLDQVDYRTQLRRAADKLEGEARTTLLEVLEE